MTMRDRWQRICVSTEYIGVDWIEVEVDLQRAAKADLLRTSVRGINYVKVHSLSPQRPSVPDVEAAAHVIRLGLRQGLLRPEKVIEGGLLTIARSRRLVRSSSLNVTLLVRSNAGAAAAIVEVAHWN